MRSGVGVAVGALVVSLACAGGPPPGAPPPGPQPEAAAPPPAPDLRPSIAPAESKALVQEARREILRAADLIEDLEARDLSDQASQRLAVTRELLAEARQALDAGDPLGASSLAHKAAVLAEDLSAH